MASTTEAPRWYGRAATVTRGGVSLAVQAAAVQMGQGRGQREGRRVAPGRGRACVHQQSRSEALRYARAIGISMMIIIGGRWLATVITLLLLPLDRGATAPIVA